jgi:hypothetical protein
MADDKKSGETGKSSGGQTAGSKTTSGGGTPKSTGKSGGQKKG